MADANNPLGPKTPTPYCRRSPYEQAVLVAKAATWDSVIASGLWEFRHCLVTLATTWFTWTVKLKWSWQQIAPAFTTQSATDVWDYVQWVDLQNDSGADWDTWFAFTWATTECRLIEVNVNTLNHLVVEVSARSAWSVTAWVRPYKD